MNAKLAKRYMNFVFKSPKLALKMLKNPRFMINRFSRAFGLERFLFLPDLQTIVLYVNSSCNMKCKMCDVGLANNKGLDMLRKTQKEKNLSLELLKKLLDDEYIKKRKINFYLLMTEPLMHPQLPEIIKMIKEKGHKVGLSTNGFLLPEKAKSLAEAGLDYLQVSIDSTEKKHDAIRGIKGTYKRAFNGIKEINKYNIPVIINVTITCLNQDDLLEFARAIEKEDVKIDELKYTFQDFISEEMKNKHNETSNIKQTTSSCSEGEISPENVNVSNLSKDLKSIAEESKSFKNIKKVSIVPFIADEKSLATYFNKKGEPIKNNCKCHMPFNQFALTTDGKVLIHIRCFNFFYGDFKENSIKEIFFNDKIKQFRKEFRKSNFCFPACTRCCGVMTFGITTDNRL